MKVLRIRNKGLVQAEDIMLIGSSTKRGDTGKIGQFGSGWKYALAWLMRNEATPIIYAGKDIIEISSRMVQHRNNVVSIIAVGGKETSITTDMGMKWTAWMALRELVSNAIDESEELIEVIDTDENGMMGLCREDFTNIFIPMIPEIEDVMAKYHHYFAFDRQPDYIGTRGMLYIKESNSPMNVYRKGIRCFDARYKTKLDFNFNEIEITEDRLIEGGIRTFDNHAKELLKHCDDVPCIKAAIMSEYDDIHPNDMTDGYEGAYRELLAEGVKFTTKTYSRILGLHADGVVISSYHFADLISKGLVSNPLEAVFAHLDFAFARIDDGGKAAQIELLLEAFDSFGKFKVYFGKMDVYTNVKIKEKDDVSEFYVKEEMLHNDVKNLAGECIKHHPKAALIIASIL